MKYTFSSSKTFRNSIYQTQWVYVHVTKSYFLLLQFNFNFDLKRLFLTKKLKNIWLEKQSVLERFLYKDEIQNRICTNMQANTHKNGFIDVLWAPNTCEVKRFISQPKTCNLCIEGHIQRPEREARNLERPFDGVSRWQRPLPKTLLRCSRRPFLCISVKKKRLVRTSLLW